MAEHRAEFMMSYRDYDGESSTVVFPGEAIDDLSLDNSAFETAVAALSTATQNITHDELVKTRRTYASDLISTDKASTMASVRELKWMVRYRDVTTLKLHRLEIPCADLQYCVAITSPHDGAQRLDLESVNGAAFVTAFEAFVKAGEDYDHDVEIVDVLLVGRNI